MFNETQQYCFNWMRGRGVPMVIKTSYEEGKPVKTEFWKPKMKKSGAAFFIEGRIVTHKFAKIAYAHDMVEFIKVA